MDPSETLTPVFRQVLQHFCCHVNPPDEATEMLLLRYFPLWAHVDEVCEKKDKNLKEDVGHVGALVWILKYFPEYLDEYLIPVYTHPYFHTVF